MPYRKVEYESNGHEVTIQQVTEDTDIRAWIDGQAGYMESALENLEHVTVSDKIERHLANGDTWNAIKTLLSWMTEHHVYFCNRCERFYDHINAQNGGFAGHHCLKCEQEDQHCPETDDNTHDIEVVSGRHNTRKPTKYKCKHCDYTDSDPATG